MVNILCFGGGLRMQMLVRLYQDNKPLFEIFQVIAPHFPRIGTFQTRIPLEDLSQCHWIKPRARMEFYDQVCEDSALAMKIYMAHKISYPSAFVGLSMMG